MALTHKDINLLTQKATIAGTEKIPVSDTEYVTPNQIASLGGGPADSSLSPTSENPVQNKAIYAEFEKVVYLGEPEEPISMEIPDTIEGIIMNNTPVSVVGGVADLGTVLTEHQDISGKENASNKVQSVSSSSTHTQYPTAKCLYDLVGNIETLLAAL